MFSYSGLSSLSPSTPCSPLILPPVLGPVLQTAGASVGGAQVADLSDKCDVVSVVQ